MAEAAERAQGIPESDRFLHAVFNRHLLPAILSVAGVTVASMANSILAGNLLGGDSLAVISVGSPVYYVFATVGALLGVGGASLASWRLGRNDHAGADTAFSVAALLALAAGLLLTVLGLLLLDPLVGLLGAKDAIVPLARPYVRYYLIGGVGVAGIYLPFNFLKLEGRLRLSVTIFLLLAALNIALDLCFILALGMGVEGIALASSLSSLAAAGAGMACLLGRSGSFRLRAVWAGGDARRLMSAGSPAALGNLCTVARGVCLNHLVFSLAGAAGLGALSILGTAYSLTLTAVSGIAQTTMPFVGVFTQERDVTSIRTLERHAARRGCIILGLATAALLVFARGFCALFGVTDPAVLALAVPAVRIFAASLVLSSLGNILVSYYLACGLTWLANLVTFCRAFALLVAPAYLLAGALGARAAWLSFALADLLTLPVLLLAAALFRRRHPERRGILLLDEGPEKRGSYISFSLHSSIEEITDASQRIGDFCARNALDPGRSMLISLSLEEMLVSIKDHVFPESGGESIDVRILIFAPEEGKDSVVILRIRCAGRQFNPVQYYKDRLASAGEAAAQAGEEDDGFGLLDALDDSLGIRMIVNTAQVVDYQSTFGVNNLTVIL